jgi:hypothetical protein
MYVEQDDISVDTSGLWAMVYLNIKVGIIVEDANTVLFLGFEGVFSYWEKAFATQ